MPDVSPYAISPVTVAQAFVDGRAQGVASTTGIAASPHPDGTHENGAWLRGFRFGFSEAVATG